jgi:hypothetical protein
MSKGSTSSLPHPPHRVLLKRSMGKMRKMLDIGMLLSMLASRLSVTGKNGLSRCKGRGKGRK